MGTSLHFKGKGLQQFALLSLFQLCVVCFVLFFFFQTGIKTDAKKTVTGLYKLKHFHNFALFFCPFLLMFESLDHLQYHIWCMKLW